MMNRRILTYIASLLITTIALQMSAQVARNRPVEPSANQQFGKLSQSDARSAGKTDVTLLPSTAWSISDPLGLRYESTIDTLFENYHANFVPSLRSIAWATTGNYGTQGQNQIFMDRPQRSEFFFADALDTWTPSIDKERFYNTRIPMTILSYSTGGNKYSNQDRTSAIFSGNVNKRLQIGASMDYLYSKGSYESQAMKNFMVGAFASYIGDRYELHTFFNNYNNLNKENGGILDDRYITNPAEVQGGQTKVDNKSIPTHLTNTHNRLVGSQFYMNHRYNVGHYRYLRDSVTDTITGRVYIPVTSFIWTFDFKANHHKFLNQSGVEDTTFFANTYLALGGTNETTRYRSFKNTVGVSLLEGFNKYAKFGFAVYGTHELRRFTQVPDTVTGTVLPDGLTPITDSIPYRHTENLFWVGGSLTKQRGSLLTYTAQARFGVLGSVAGDIDISGDMTTKFRLGRDSVRIRAYGYFKNLEAPYLMKRFVSNHFVWANNFSKEQRFRVGGELVIPWTRTRVNLGYETLKNYLYFNTEALPAQHSSPIHVLSVTADQRLALRAFHWDNMLTYQATSDNEVLPLPTIAIYSNLYFKFLVARVLHVQIGVDANYYTRYYAPNYNPATASFYTQVGNKCGNFLFMNAYANFKLKKARFYLMYSHANKGLFGGDNYFSIPHYPLNPGRFQLGVSVDFAN